MSRGLSLCVCVARVARSDLTTANHRGWGAVVVDRPQWGGIRAAARPSVYKSAGPPPLQGLALVNTGGIRAAEGGANRRVLPSLGKPGIVPWQECLAARGRHGRQRGVSTRRVHRSGLTAGPLLLAGGRLGFEGDILQNLSLARSAVDDRLTPACPTAARSRPRSSTGPGKGQGRRRNARSGSNVT